MFDPLVEECARYLAGRDAVGVMRDQPQQQDAVGLQVIEREIARGVVSGGRIGEVVIQSLSHVTTNEMTAIHRQNGSNEPDG